MTIGFVYNLIKLFKISYFLMLGATVVPPEALDHSHNEKNVPKSRKRIRQKKKTSERLLTHFDRLKELHSQQEQEIVDQTSSHTSDSTIAMFDNSECISFEKSIEMEYYQLNKEQLDITRAFMNGTTIATIKRDLLPTLNVSATDPSIKTCIIRTLEGNKWSPSMSGSYPTHLSFLDEIILSNLIRAETDNGHSLLNEDVYAWADIFYKSRISFVRKLLQCSYARSKNTYLEHFAVPESTDNKFNYGWLRSFLERYDLKLSAPEMIEDLRMKYGNQGTILRWFNQNKILASSFKQQNIFNMDEMNIKINNNQRVIAKVNSKAYKCKGKEFKHITACCCFSAFGHQMPIYLLSDFKNLYPEYQEIQESNHMTFGSSKSGWITREHFFEWCKKFVTWCNTITNPSEKRLLYLDSHNSRENVEALSLLRDNNIVVLTFPPHCTHILQPFDVTIARSFKSKIREFYNKYKIGKESLSERESKYLLILAVISAWKSAINIGSATTAFQITGLYPFDEKNPLSSPYTQPSTIDYELQELNNRLRTSSKELTSEDYLHDLKTRDFLKSIKPTCRIQYSSCINSKKLEGNINTINTTESLKIIKNISSLDASKFLEGIKSLIDSDVTDIIYPNPVQVMFSCASMYKPVLNAIPAREAEWLNRNRGIPIGLSYNQKIRFALDIAETVYGLEHHDYRHEDMFRKELHRMEEYNSIRWNKIVQNIETVSGYDINDISEAIFVLALIVTDNLEEYKKTHECLPNDPYAELIGIEQVFQ